MHILEKLNHRITSANSLLCIGLDSDFDKIPDHFHTDPDPQFAFNRWIIEQTHSFALAYKPNLAFYESVAGYRALTLTMQYLRAEHPELVTIADAKRADIGSTNIGYVRSIFDELGFDAVTLNPYLGQEALTPFLERAEKGCIILCHTSNPGANEFQGLHIEDRPLWLHVAERVSTHWNQHHNCLLVVGATEPSVLAQVRQVIGDMPILVPGIGVQGGDLEAVLAAGLTLQRAGLIINASRSIIFTDHPATAAQSLQLAINQQR